MLVEFTAEKEKILINPDRISLVRQKQNGAKNFVQIYLDGGDIKVSVDQDFEEVKKRLGMTITPRAETLAI